MAIEEDREEDFERVFKELYLESMCMTKKNKELSEQLEAIKHEKKALEEMIKCKDMELKHSKTRKEELQDQLTSKARDFNMLLGGSHKLSNKLL